ncbi:hypothetical protein [Yersinia rohdei]|uniref:Uncharacterized protein n=1 Tax=Yersinia rohdei TaxID=29485 RepID=A0A0U1HYB1_YERRO|nr:hypothetical protein [Yersinia rohdei]CQI97846.1 Uncharacterised protein [Yersinia rohdei]CQJ62525.1 Uncharacterised protein [Yersinia rohdei]
MIDISMLDKFKDAYLELLKQRSGKELDMDDLYLEKDYSIVDSIQGSIRNLNLTIELFFNAQENDDELAMQAALLRISAFLSGISGVFYQTTEDIDRFFKLPDEISFPEDYKIPEHYNYPIK